MPHTIDGRIYIDTSTDPHTGIDVVGDIAYVLGRNTGDIHTLYNDSNIEWGSRYKPVPWDGNVHPQGSHPNDWQKGKDGDYGIKANTLHTYDAANIINIIDGNMNGWSYERDSHIARVFDFDNYWHSAQSPFGTLHTEGKYDISNFAPGEDVGIKVDGEVVASGLYQLSVYGDIKILGYYGGSERNHLLEVQELYIGFVIYYYYNGAWRFQKCIILSDKIKNLNPPHLYSLGAFTRPDPISSWPVDFRCYPALFDTDETDTESGLPRNGYNIVPIPGWNYQPVTITETVGPGVTSVVATIGYDDTQGIYYNYGNFECYIKGNDHDTTTVYVTAELLVNGTVIKTMYNNVRYTILPGQTQRIGRAEDNLHFNNSAQDSPPNFYIAGYTAEQFYNNNGSVDIYIDGVLAASRRFYREH